MKYTNPIIPGFAPDPSLVLVDDTFYLVTSSFHLFPGLPIYASKDLQSWTRASNALSRPSQLSLSGATTRAFPHLNNTTLLATGGLWAPTIRYHNGNFYIICTNVSITGPDFAKQNFYITCPSKEILVPGSWSDPILFDFNGIDPSLFFDDDGKVYVQGAWDLNKGRRPKTQPSCTIMQFEIDLVTGKPVSEIKEIWGGYHKIDTEGPHIYKKDGWYYLLVAEGGTFANHLLSIARSKNIWGPYESYEYNPLTSKTTRTEDAVIQDVGHAELFQDRKDVWWAIVLGIRNQQGRYPLGRETFLTPVSWPKDGWPSISQPQLEFERDSITSSPPVPSEDRAAVRAAQRNVAREAELEFVFIRDPVSKNYNHPEDKKTISLIPTSIDLSSPEGSPTFIGKRQRSLDCTASVTLHLPSSHIPSSCPLIAGLAIYKDAFRHVSISYHHHPYSASPDLSSNSSSTPPKIVVQLTNISSSTTADIGEAILPTLPSSVDLKIDATEKAYILSYGMGEADFITLGEIDTVEMTGRDFTGTLFGIFAIGEQGAVRFEDFEVED